MIDRTDVETCRIGLLWIRRHRELHRQPASAAIDRALAALDRVTSAMSVDGQNPFVAQQEWITTGEAARRTGYTERHIRRLAPQIGQKVGRVWAIRADALED